MQDREDLEVDFRAAVAADLDVLAALHDRELDAEMLAALSAAGFPRSLGLDIGGSGPRGEAALAAMAAVTDEVTEDLADGSLSFDELGAAYADVYLTRGMGVSPTESPWVDKDGLERQQPTVECRKWYGRHSLKVTEWNRRSEDHIVHQLEFVAHLLRNGEGDEALGEAARFLTQHPLRWFPEFARLLDKRGGPAFYTALAELTAVYLADLRTLLCALVPDAAAGEIPEIAVASECGGKDGLGKCAARQYP